jgi:hypothetical protein
MEVIGGHARGDLDDELRGTFDVAVLGHAWAAERWPYEEGVRLNLSPAVQVDRGVVCQNHVGPLRNVEGQPAHDEAVRLSVLGQANWGRHVHDSVNELGLLDVRARQVPAVELLAGQVVTSFKMGGRVDAHGHVPTSPGVGSSTPYGISDEIVRQTSTSAGAALGHGGPPARPRRAASSGRALSAAREIGPAPASGARSRITLSGVTAREYPRTSMLRSLMPPSWLARRACCRSGRREVQTRREHAGRAP